MMQLDLLSWAWWSPQVTCPLERDVWERGAPLGITPGSVVLPVFRRWLRDLVQSGGWLHAGGTLHVQGDVGDRKARLLADALDLGWIERRGARSTWVRVADLTLSSYRATPRLRGLIGGKP